MLNEDANDEERSLEFCGLRVLPGLKREGLVAWILLDSLCVLGFVPFSPSRFFKRSLVCRRVPIHNISWAIRRKNPKFHGQ